MVAMLKRQGQAATGGAARRRIWHIAWAVGKRLLLLLAVVVWIGAVVYPDPRPFVKSIERLRRPPVDAAAVAGLAAELPRNYQVIEDFVLNYVRYEPAWTVYGLPWYFPTVPETLAKRAGDCQARAVLEASILEAKGMPYTLCYSFDHVWVDYPGKPRTDLEDSDTAFVRGSGRGWLASLPERFPLWDIIKVRVAYHWTPMPLLQKVVLLLGIGLIVGWGERRLWRKIGRQLGGLGGRIMRRLTTAT
ncbi:MAG: transglutaminase domain-containing protein [Thermoleophilia bacterium]|nr:transglutaminase domain-containing protein [Thermoleophilia bacterium]